MKKPTLRFKEFDGEWNECVLKERASFSKGFGYSKNDLIDAGHPIVLYGRLYTKYQTVISDIDTFVDVKEGSVLSQGNEVVIPASGECAEDIARASVIADKNIILGGDLNIIKPDKSLDSVFLALSISYGSAHSKLVSQSQGATIAHLHNAEIQNVVVSYPSDKAEQAAIGSFFTELDSLIEGKRVKLDKLKKLKLAYLSKMFPKKGARIPEVRFKGFSGDWKKTTLGELVSSFDYGLNAAAKDYDGVNKYIRITDIDDSSRRFSMEDVSSPDVDLTTANNYLVQPGDILFARTGASVGKTYLYRKEDGKVYYAGFLIRGTFKANVSPEFVFQNTLTENYNQFIKITSQRSGQPGVNAVEYKTFSFMLPSLPEQQKIGAFFQNLDNLINLQQQELDKLANIKSACLSKMFA